MGWALKSTISSLWNGKNEKKYSSETFIKDIRSRKKASFYNKICATYSLESSTTFPASVRTTRSTLSRPASLNSSISFLRNSNFKGAMFASRSAAKISDMRVVASNKLYPYQLASSAVYCQNVITVSMEQLKENLKMYCDNKAHFCVTYFIAIMLVFGQHFFLLFRLIGPTRNTCMNGFDHFTFNC